MVEHTSRNGHIKLMIAMHKYKTGIPHAITRNLYFSIKSVVYHFTRHILELFIAMWGKGELGGDNM